jgi:hypothetical protein
MFELTGMSIASSFHQLWRDFDRGTVLTVRSIVRAFVVGAEP